MQGPDIWPGNRLAVTPISSTPISNANDNTGSFYAGGTGGAGGAYLAVTVSAYNAVGNLDAWRNNQSSTPLGLAPGTNATRISGDQGNFNGKGIALHVKTANLAGAPTITPRIQWKDNSGNYNTIWTAAAAIAANGDKVYLLYPGAADAAGWTEVKQTAVPRVFRVVLVYAGNGTTDVVDTTCDLEILL